jgi:signal transduction histidine kinase/CheY-like chemotaxis protein
VGLQFSELWWLVNPLQRDWILFCYAWEVPVIGWTGAVLIPWLTLRRLQHRLHAGDPGAAAALARYPFQVGAIVLGTSTVGYLLGAVQIYWSAALPMLEFAKITIQGPAIGGLFGVAAYFMAERAVQDLPLAPQVRAGLADATVPGSLHRKILSITVALVIGVSVPIFLYSLSDAQRRREELRAHALHDAVRRSASVAELQSSLSPLGASTYGFALRESDGRIVEGRGAGSPLLAGDRRDFRLEGMPDNGWFASRDGEHKVVAFDRRPDLTFVAVSPIQDYGQELAVSARTAGLVALGALVIGLLLAAMLARSIVSPLDRLRAAATQMAAGDLAVGSVGLLRGDEIAAVAQAFDRMAERVRADEADLRMAYERVQRAQQQLVEQERLSAIGRVVSGVAHEINNPLAAVLNLAEDLRSDPTLPQSERDMLDLIADQVRRCRRIVRDLLSFAGDRERRLEATPVDALLRSVTAGLESILRQTGARYEATIEGAPPILMVDRQALEQVLTNLLANGAEAAGRDGVVRLRASGDGKGWCFVIEDSGPGVPPHVFPHIYEPFFSTKPEGEGSGLGLPVARGLIEWHGGTLEAESGGQGGGARFTVRIPPLVPAREVALADPGEGHADGTLPWSGAEARRRALIIDDERAVRLALGRYLQRHGWEVDQATDGEEALRILESTPPSGYGLVITDLRMPRLSGLDVHDWMAEHRPDLFARLIVTTGDVISPNVQAFLARTPRPVIEKPFELSMLAQVMERVV